MTAPAPPMAPPSKGRTRLTPEARREQIIAAADALFDGRDPSDVTFEEIAEQAGVSRALVYNYFGDKGGLIAAVYLRAFERLDVELAGAFHETAAGSERLRAVIRCYFDFAEANLGCCKLISLAEATEHPLVRHARRRRLERMAEGWSQEPEARLLARGILSFLEGSALQWLEEPECPRHRAEHVLFTLLWSGLTGMAAGGVTLPAGPDRPA